MEASVTVKMSPQEFDLLRTALVVFTDHQLKNGDNTQLDARTRRDAKSLAVRGKALIEKVH